MLSATAAEINTTVFLASRAAAYVTGECLYVDGGHALQGPISALPPDGYPERRLPIERQSPTEGQIA